MTSAPLTHDPIITIGVPTYNSAPSLPNFLIALEALDYPKDKMRLVFVDNLSTDDTPTMLGEFLQRQGGYYEKALMFSLKSSIPQARNICIENSVGDYLLFLDSDVIPPQNTAKRMIEIFHFNRDVAILGFPYRSRFATHSDSEGSERLRHEPHQALLVQAGCMMIKLGLIKKIGGFHILFVFDEDFEFCVRAFRAGYRAIIDPTQSVLHLNAATSRVTRRGSVKAFLLVLKSKGRELMPSRHGSIGSALQNGSLQASFRRLPIVLCLAFWKAAVTLALIVFYSFSFVLQSFRGRKSTVADAIGFSWLGLPLLASLASFRLLVRRSNSLKITF